MKFNSKAGVLALGALLALSAKGADAEIGDLLWSFQASSSTTNGDYFTQPAIGPDGTIYVGYIPSEFSSSGTFYALNTTGKERWSKSFTFSSYSTGSGHKAVFQTPSVGDDGTVYLSCSGSQYAFSAEGTRLWKKTYSTTDPRDLTAGLSPVAISSDGRIYLPQGDRSLMELDPSNGNTLWSFQSTAEHRFSFARYAVIDTNGDLFLSAWKNNLFKIGSGGDLIYRYNSGGKDFPSGSNPSALSSTGRVVSPQGRSYDHQYLAVRGPDGSSFPTFLTAYPGVSVSPVIDHDQSMWRPFLEVPLRYQSSLSGARRLRYSGIAMVRRFRVGWGK